VHFRSESANREPNPHSSSVPAAADRRGLVVRPSLDPRAYSRSPGRLTAGNRLDLLVDGDEAFPSMLECIRGARFTVHLETYILADDAIGTRFAEALIDRAQRGLQVRVLFDSLGSLTLSSDYLRSLTDAGVEAVEFRPIRKHWFRRTAYQRDHRKLLIVDGRVGFTGGLNVSSDYASMGAESKGWRDTHVKVEGPVVSDLEALFRASWHRSGGTPYRTAEASPTPAADGGVLAAVVASDGGRRSVIRSHYQHAFTSARDTIFIANAYFVPDRGLLRGLIRAARRGVRVVLIVSTESDVALVQYASEYLYDRLLRRGIEIHRWPETHMHAKTAVVDGIWAVVGSYNLDSVSRFQNQEAVIESVGPGFAAVMLAQFRRDIARCNRLSLAEWRRRPRSRRAIEWLAYRMRRWL
jgi:cardiolipin synthase